MTPRASKPTAGLVIPWPLIGVAVAILSGVIWLNVQIATLGAEQKAMAEKVDLLFTLEMDRHPRAGPATPER